MSASQFSHAILAQMLLQAPPGDVVIGVSAAQAQQLVLEFMARQAPATPMLPPELAKDVARWRFVRDMMLRFPTRRGNGVDHWLYAISWHSIEELRPEAFDRMVDEVMQTVASGGAGNGALEALLQQLQKSEPTTEPTVTDNLHGKPEEPRSG
jgi:hypothetical protein